MLLVFSFSTAEAKLALKNFMYRLIFVPIIFDLGLTVFVVYIKKNQKHSFLNIIFFYITLRDK